MVLGHTVGVSSHTALVHNHSLRERRRAHALLGQILARLGREPEARRAFGASAATYRAVLEEPKVQGDPGSFRETCDLVYNYGFYAAAQCGQAADAAAALRQALQAGGTSAAEMQSDPNLVEARPALIPRAPATLIPSKRKALNRPGER